jgi:hypothetical protein
MKQIRKNVFETNSSSTHSICIANTSDLIIPNEIEFKFGEFGWEIDKLSSIEEKASYLYTALYAFDELDYIDELKQIFIDKGITTTFDDPNDVDCGYIDHYSELSDFIKNIKNNENVLFEYLFSPLSFVLTGNDNDDYDVDINVDYDHIDFYKGN